MGKLVEQAGTRIGIIEMNATTTAHSMQEVQGMVSVLTAGLNEVTVEIQKIRSSNGQGHQDPWSGRTLGAPHQPQRPATTSAPTFGAQSQQGLPSGFVPTTPPGPTTAPSFAGGFYGTPPGMGGQGETAKNGRWALYDEKYITLPALAQHNYDPRKPLDWLQSLRDYVSGRSPEFNLLLDWVERQTEPITESLLSGIGSGGCLPMVDVAPSLSTISRQFWALLSPLVAETCVIVLGTTGWRHGGCLRNRSTTTS